MTDTPNPTDETATTTPPEAESSEAEPPEGEAAEPEGADAPMKPTIEGLQLRNVVDLPESGKTAHVHTPLGKHFRKALRFAQQKGRQDPALMQYAMLEEIVTIDGEQKRVDQYDDLPYRDIMTLLDAAGLLEDMSPLG